MKKLSVILFIFLLISILSIKSLEITEKQPSDSNSDEQGQGNKEDDIVIEEVEEEEDTSVENLQQRLEKLKKQKFQEYNGECEEEAKLCLPFAHLSFAESVWGKKTPQDYLKDLNNFVSENFIFKKEVEFEIDNEFNLKAILKEDVENGDTLAAYFNQDEVYTYQSLGRIFFNSFDEVDVHQTQMRRLKFENVELINRNRLQFFVALLYHFYHIEHSKYAADLRLFPRTVVNPMYTLTMYELDKFVKFDKFLYNSVIERRKEVLKQYEQLKEELTDKLSEQELTSFLHGRSIIPLDDFVYISAMVDAKGIATTHQSLKKDEIFFFIQPVVNHLNFGENFLKEQRQLRFHFTGKDLYSSRIFFNRDIQEGFQILIDFLEHKSQVFFLNNGIVPNQNDQDCVNVKFMDEDLVESFKLLDNLCLNKDHMYLEHYHSVAIILNMDEVEKELCTQTIKKYNLKDPNENKKIFNRKCEFKSGFKKFDFWKEPMSKLKEIGKSYNELYAQLDEYVKERAENNKSISNSVLLTRYLQNRMQIIIDIQKKIKEMINESLKKKEPMSDPRPNFGGSMKNQEQDDVERVEL